VAGQLCDNPLEYFIQFNARLTSAPRISRIASEFAAARLKSSNATARILSRTAIATRLADLFMKVGSPQGKSSERLQRNQQAFDALHPRRQKNLPRQSILCTITVAPDYSPPDRKYRTATAQRTPRASSKDTCSINFWQDVVECSLPTVSPGSWRRNGFPILPFLLW